MAALDLEEQCNAATECLFRNIPPEQARQDHVTAVPPEIVRANLDRRREIAVDRQKRDAIPVDAIEAVPVDGAPQSSPSINDAVV